MKRKALFVGVNEYEDDRFEKLGFAKADAKSLHDFFQKSGFDVSLLTDDPTKEDLLKKFSQSIEGLKPGDFFLFFFAGHGFIHGGNELIFCKDDDLGKLRYCEAGISVDALLAKAEGGGFHRSFIFDSCRSDFLTGIRGVFPQAQHRDVSPDVGRRRDMSASGGSYTVLRSCRKFDYAREVAGFRHGLFTQSMLDVLKARDTRQGLSIGQSFLNAVSGQMQLLSSSSEMECGQMPTIEISGEIPVIIEPCDGEVSAKDDPEVEAFHRSSRRHTPHSPLPDDLTSFLWEVCRLYRPMLAESALEHRKLQERDGQEAVIADALEVFQARLRDLTGDDGEDAPELDFDALRDFFEDVCRSRLAYRKHQPYRPYFIEHRRLAIEVVEEGKTPSAPVVEALFKSINLKLGERRKR